MHQQNLTIVSKIQGPVARPQPVECGRTDQWAHTTLAPLTRHIHRADRSHNHTRALQASINCLPEEWRRPNGRRRQSWLQTIKGDLKTLNISSAWHIPLASCRANSYTLGGASHRC